MAYDLLIHRGTIYSSQGSHQADVAIRDGKIVDVGIELPEEAIETLDASGLAVLPGLIDSQVHFREPGMEQKEDLQTGTQSAVLGGVTTVLEMPNTNPPTTSREALEDKVRRAKGRAWCNTGFFVGAAEDNLDQLRELEELPGTPGIKIFMGSSTGSLLLSSEASQRTALQNGRHRCAVHAEDADCLKGLEGSIPNPSVSDHPSLRASKCALSATRRILALCEETGRPIHILHISTAEELPVIKKAKSDGVRVTAEVTPQHLLFSAPKCYEMLGTRSQMNPPIRSEEHRQAIRAALQGGLFDVIGSDHAPHTIEEKNRPYPQSPSGMPGVQTLLSVMLTMIQREGLITVEDLVGLAAENPARLYSLTGKGFIRKGFDADLVLVDLKRAKTLDRSWIRSKCGWSPYEGMELIGWPVHTLVQGSYAVRDGELQLEPHGSIPAFREQVAVPK